jgi:predicted metalloprotease
MEWTPDGDNSDVEDRRGETGGGGGGGFNIGGFGGMHFGIGGTLLLIVLSFVFKTNLLSVLGGGGGGVPTSSVRPAPNRVSSATETKEAQLAIFVLNDVQKTWAKLLPQQANIPYRHAKLVLFTDETESGCGDAQSATGPFYCPEDEKVYIDLGFFQELSNKFGAPGEFAEAYVVAHELGHHVQKLLGTESKVQRLSQSNPSQKNPLSVKLELQADCYAGVWGHMTEERKIIDDADVANGLRAAASVGDDRLQRMATGHVTPENFTHGTSAQRSQWFQTGLRSGTIAACDTFGAR